MEKMKKMVHKMEKIVHKLKKKIIIMEGIKINNDIIWVIIRYQAIKLDPFLLYFRSTGCPLTPSLL